MIDLSQLPAPEVVEPLDFEGIYQDLLATFRALMKASAVTFSP